MLKPIYDLYSELKDEAKKSISFTKEYVIDVSNYDSRYKTAPYRVEVVNGKIDKIVNVNTKRTLVMDKRKPIYLPFEKAMCKAFDDLNKKAEEITNTKEVDNTFVVNTIQEKSDELDKNINELLERKNKIDELLVLTKASNNVKVLLNAYEELGNILDSVKIC